MKSITCLKINRPANICVPPQGFAEDLPLKGIGFQVDYSHLIVDYL